MLFSLFENKPKIYLVARETAKKQQKIGKTASLLYKSKK